MSIVLYHRWRAAASGEKVLRREEGYAFAAVLRLAGVFLFLSTAAYLVFPESVAWASLPLPLPMRWVGAAGALCSALLMHWTLASLGTNLTDTVVTRNEATLVTHGPYRWVRHPFYVVTALTMLSVALLAANWWIAAWCAILWGLLAIRTPKEEQMLIARFGDDYRLYMQQTGRFVPRLKHRAASNNRSPRLP